MQLCMTQRKTLHSVPEAAALCSNLVAYQASGAHGSRLLLLEVKHYHPHCLRKQ